MGRIPPNGDLCGAIGALSAEHRRLIEQLFWEERTETEVADAMGTNQWEVGLPESLTLSPEEISPEVAIIKGLLPKSRG
jgi:hypothetical protein